MPANRVMVSPGRTDAEDYARVMRVCLLLMISLALCQLAACTSQQAYGVGQAWQRNQCFMITDAEERSRCLESANTPYEQYQLQREGGE